MEANQPFRVCIVDDQSDLIEGLTSVLKDRFGKSIDIATEIDFEAAALRLAEESWDLVILDVRGPADDDSKTPAGRRVFEKISGIRWVPLVFYTAKPSDVRDLEQPPLVQVVKKGLKFDNILAAVEDGLASGAPALTRELGSLVEDRVRCFLRDLIAPNWESMQGVGAQELTHIVINRLAAWLKEHATSQLQELHGSTPLESIHQATASQVYLYPPVVQHLTSGDVLLDRENQWWVVLTPACDFVQRDAGPNGQPPERKRKAEFVRVAPCVPLIDHPAVQGKARQAVTDAIRGDGRYRYLPRYLSIPEVLVDQQRATPLPYSTVASWQRVATLDSPFVEDLVVGFGNYSGRVGTPDFDGKEVAKRLLERSVTNAELTV